MLSEEERQMLEHMVSESARTRDLQKELQEYLDKMLERIIIEEEKSHESTT